MKSYFFILPFMLLGSMGYGMKESKARNSIETQFNKTEKIENLALQFKKKKKPGCRISALIVCGGLCLTGTYLAYKLCRHLYIRIKERNNVTIHLPK